MRKFYQAYSRASYVSQEITDAIYKTLSLIQGRDGSIVAVHRGADPR